MGETKVELAKAKEEREDLSSSLELLQMDFKVITKY